MKRCLRISMESLGSVLWAAPPATRNDFIKIKADDDIVRVQTGLPGLADLPDSLGEIEPYPDFEASPQYLGLFSTTTS
jgi:hypothetical protein